jgi:hypothetical protein
MNNNIVNIALSIIIILCCLTFIGFIAFTDLLSDRIAGNKKYIFLAIISLYTILRAFRLRKMLKDVKIFK